MASYFVRGVIARLAIAAPPLLVAGAAWSQGAGAPAGSGSVDVAPLGGVPERLSSELNCSMLVIPVPEVAP